MAQDLDTIEAKEQRDATPLSVAVGTAHEPATAPSNPLATECFAQNISDAAEREFRDALSNAERLQREIDEIEGEVGEQRRDVKGRLAPLETAQIWLAFGRGDSSSAARSQCPRSW